MLININISRKQLTGLKDMNNFASGILKKIGTSVLLLVVATACAETPQESKVKALLEKNMGEGAKVDAIVKTQYSGLYEVQSNGSIFYTDAKAEYVFAGQIFETKSRKNLTKERVAEINQVKFTDLPLDLAMKTVKGDGKRVIAVFADPNCGYCKRLEQNLKEVDNVTVYTFMYNILSADSAKKSKDVWCSTDKQKVWDDWMLNGKVPPAAKEKCEEPGAKVYELGKKLRVDGTPTIIFTDGSRVSGAITAKEFEEKFATLK